jgi:hypothetical protein
VDDVLRWAKERLAPRADPAATEAVLARAREGLESLAQSAAELETELPQRVQDAVRDGMRAEALPVARNLAELRGLAAQTIRRLEALETALEAERHARVDDLALLIELFSAGWQGVEARLAGIEATLEAPSLARAS